LRLGRLSLSFDGEPVMGGFDAGWQRSAQRGVVEVLTSRETGVMYYLHLIDDEARTFAACVTERLGVA